MGIQETTMVRTRAMTRAASAVSIVSGEIEKPEDALHSLIAAADGLCIGCDPKNRHHARCEPSLCSVCTRRVANKIGRIPETYQDLRNAGLVPEVLREVCADCNNCGTCVKCHSSATAELGPSVAKYVSELCMPARPFAAIKR